MKNIFTAMIALIITIFMFTGLIKYISVTNEYNEITEMQYNIDMASDTALADMLHSSGDLAVDYYYLGRINVDPRVGIDSFRRSMCLCNYDYDTETGHALVDSKYVGGIIICYDGYYVVRDLHSPVAKIPYEYKDSTGERYFVNLTDKFISKLNTTTGALTKVEITSDNRSKIVSQLEDRINLELNLMIQNKFGQESTNEMYVPFFRRALDTNNAIDSTSCIFLMDYGNIYEHKLLYAVSGSSIILNRFCLGYERDGGLYYTTANNHTKVHYPIKRMFKNQKDAAQLGYTYDLKIIE